MIRILFLHAAFCGVVCHAEIFGPLIRVGDDAATESTIHWVADSDDLLLLKHGDGWAPVAVQKQPFGPSDLTAYRAKLSNLSAGATYRFKIGDAEFSSRTLPEKADELRFAVGGDMMHVPEMLAKTTKQLGARSPHFAVYGGDLAYANGADVKRWKSFLSVLAEAGVDSDGRLIPAIVCIGNHEVKGGYHKTAAEAPFFYSLFEFADQKSNHVQDVGGMASFVVLDSNHTQSVEGQTDWLAKVLADKADMRYRFSVYHFPAYGIMKGGLNSNHSKDIRANWVPLFEKHRVRLSFENDHHVYKRSKPVRNGKVDAENGVTYIGDGAYGVRLRKLPKNWKDLWYVEKAKSIRHFVLVTAKMDGLYIESIDEDGEVFDTCVIKP